MEEVGRKFYSSVLLVSIVRDFGFSEGNVESSVKKDFFFLGKNISGCLYLSRFLFFC